MEVCSLWDSTRPNIYITSKKASNKSCSKPNFTQKSSRAHMSISPTSGARGLQRSICLKSYNVQKQEIRFTLRLNTAKNTYFMKKASNKSCLKSNFAQKKSESSYVYLPHEWSQGPRRSVCLKSYNVQKWEIRFTLVLNTAKNTHFMKKRLEIKVARNRISHKIVGWHKCLSPPQVELGGYKDQYV